MNKLLAAAFVALFLVGCQTDPVQAPVEDKSTTADPSAAAAGASTSGMAGAGVGGTSTAGTAASADAQRKAALKDPNNILSRRVILFEFDSFVVADTYKPMIEAHAKYLTADRSAKVTLQGHADERGSREYNIALGQKRADAVKRMMTLLGVQEIQVETVSFGEEKPKNPASNEAAWAENRRVEIVHAGE